MSVIYPPGYESTPRRSDDEVMQEWNRRCGYTQGEVRSIPLDQASPPPEGKESKSSYNIHVPRGAKRLGFKGGCGKNGKAKQ